MKKPTIRKKNSKSPSKENRIALEIPIMPKRTIEQEVTAILFHELRTPLTGTIGYIQIMQIHVGNLLSSIEKHGKNKEMQCDFSLLSLALKEFSDGLNILNHCSSDQIAILNHVLDFNKFNQSHVELESKHFYILKDLFAPLKQLYTPLSLEKGIDFIIDLPKEDQALTGDVHRLKQIINNLLTNALKFATPIGQNRACIELNLSINNKKGLEAPIEIAFKIKNTGTGLTQETIDQLFKPYFQTDPSIARQFGGTGLGLTVCAQLVQLMKGKITCTSSVSAHWVQFDIKLALPSVKLDSLPKFKRKDEKSKNLPSLKGIKILLAEDNLINQRMIEKMLVQSDCTVHISSNGREAIDQFKKETYSLILMDIYMPTMGGIEATHNIREIEKEKKISAPTPILGLSADTFADELEKVKHAGMNDFITKPIDMHILFDKIIQYCKASTSGKSAIKTYENLFKPIAKTTPSQLAARHSHSLFVKHLQPPEESSSHLSSPRSSVSSSSDSMDQSLTSPLSDLESSELIDFERLYLPPAEHLPDSLKMACKLAKATKDSTAYAQAKLGIIQHYFSLALKKKDDLSKNNELKQEINLFNDLFTKLSEKQQFLITISSLTVWENLQGQAAALQKTSVLSHPLLQLAQEQSAHWQQRADQLLEEPSSSDTLAVSFGNFSFS